MKLRTILIVTLIFLFAISCKRNERKLFVTPKSGLVLRKEPKVSPNNSIRVLPAATRVQIIQEGNSEKIAGVNSKWYEVIYKNENKEEQGWVFGGFAYEIKNPDSPIDFQLGHSGQPHKYIFYKNGSVTYTIDKYRIGTFAEDAEADGVYEIKGDQIFLNMNNGYLITSHIYEDNSKIEVTKIDKINEKITLKYYTELDGYLSEKEKHLLTDKGVKLNKAQHLFENLEMNVATEMYGAEATNIYYLYKL